MHSGESTPQRRQPPAATAHYSQQGQTSSNRSVNIPSRLPLPTSTLLTLLLGRTVGGGSQPCLAPWLQSVATAKKKEKEEAAVAASSSPWDSRCRLPHRSSDCFFSPSALSSSPFTFSRAGLGWDGNEHIPSAADGWPGPRAVDFVFGPAINQRRPFAQQQLASSIAASSMRSNRCCWAGPTKRVVGLPAAAAAAPRPTPKGSKISQFTS